MERTGNQYVRGGRETLDLFGTKIGKTDGAVSDRHKANIWIKRFKDIYVACVTKMC